MSRSSTSWSMRIVRTSVTEDSPTSTSTDSVDLTQTGRTLLSMLPSSVIDLRPLRNPNSPAWSDSTGSSPSPSPRAFPYTSQSQSTSRFQSTSGQCSIGQTDTWLSTGTRSQHPAVNEVPPYPPPTQRASNTSGSSIYASQLSFTQEPEAFTSGGELRPTFSSNVIRVPGHYQQAPRRTAEPPTTYHSRFPTSLGQSSSSNVSFSTQAVYTSFAEDLANSLAGLNSSRIRTRGSAVPLERSHTQPVISSLTSVRESSSSPDSTPEIIVDPPSGSPSTASSPSSTYHSRLPASSSQSEPYSFIQDTYTTSFIENLANSLAGLTSSRTRSRGSAGLLSRNQAQSTIYSQASARESTSSLDSVPEISVEPPSGPPSTAPSSSVSRSPSPEPSPWYHPPLPHTNWYRSAAPRSRPRSYSPPPSHMRDPYAQRSTRTATKEPETRGRRDRSLPPTPIARPRRTAWPPSNKEPSPPRYARKLRVGFWNRRGDHLTSNGYVVYAPYDRAYPEELHDYPGEREGYRDQYGTVAPWREERPELPGSMSLRGRPPVHPYEAFIVYTHFQ